jgi:hypothetical protein
MDAVVAEGRLLSVQLRVTDGVGTSLRSLRPPDASAF